MITQFYIELLEGPGQGRTFTFTKDRVRVGRAPDNDLVLVDGSVSRYHCELMVRGAAVELSDAHSTNGVKLNGRKLQDVALLRDLDVIELADFSLLIKVTSLQLRNAQPVQDTMHRLSYLQHKCCLPRERQRKRGGDRTRVSSPTQPPYVVGAKKSCSDVKQRSQRSSSLLLGQLSHLH